MSTSISTLRSGIQLIRIRTNITIGKSGSITRIDGLSGLTPGGRQAIARMLGQGGTHWYAIGQSLQEEGLYMGLLDEFTNYSIQTKCFHVDCS